eukprot:scaffold923_cov85-Cylindrotheca_fusiformis.AAC.2
MSKTKGNNTTNNTKADRIYWKEHEIAQQTPRTMFNFYRRPQGRIDDFDIISSLPCRAITNWFLTLKTVTATEATATTEPSHTQIKSKIRRALPTKSYGLTDYILTGRLLPMGDQNDDDDDDDDGAYYSPIWVELDQLEYYIIDQARPYRGYWIITNVARYWLQQPCKATVLIKSFKVVLLPSSSDHDAEYYTPMVDTTTTTSSSSNSVIRLPSQARLHLFHRAQLGLLSNLIDVFFCPTKQQQFVHRFNLYNYSPERLHRLLSPSAELRAYHRNNQKKKKKHHHHQNNQLLPLFDHPFDLNLLLQSSNFLLPHIAIWHPCIKDSQFYKDLQERNNTNTTTTTTMNNGTLLLLFTEQEEIQWKESAIQAERRSRQNEFGLPEDEGDDSNNNNNNLRYPLELELERHFSLPNDDAFSTSTITPTTTIANANDAAAAVVAPSMEQQDEADSDCSVSTESSIQSYDIMVPVVEIVEEEDTETALATTCGGGIEMEI